MCCVLSGRGLSQLTIRATHKLKITLAIMEKKKKRKNIY